MTRQRRSVGPWRLRRCLFGPTKRCTTTRSAIHRRPLQNITPAARREAAQAFFEPIEEDKSLIFYYSNYSNPFSEDENQRYVVTGISRIKTVGSELLWTKQSERMRDRYGPNAWFRDISSYYPEQGLRIPYHRYMDRPDVIDRILFVPENSRDFKYATRHVSDDSALSLVERFLEVVGTLEELGDESENWLARRQWLSSVGIPANPITDSRARRSRIRGTGSLIEAVK